MSKLKIIVSCIVFFSAVAALMSWFCIAVLKADSSFLSLFTLWLILLPTVEYTIGRLRRKND